MPSWEVSYHAMYHKKYKVLVSLENATPTLKQNTRTCETKYMYIRDGPLMIVGGGLRQSRHFLPAMQCY